MRIRTRHERYQHQPSTHSPQACRLRAYTACIIEAIVRYDRAHAATHCTESDSRADVILRPRNVCVSTERKRESTTGSGGHTPDAAHALIVKDELRAI